MKKLTIMRHGKADPRGRQGLKDIDRKLEERGREDAPRVGEFYAQRALETARLFAEGAGYNKDIKVDDRDLIYEGDGSGSVDNLMTVIRDLERDHIMIIDHNNDVSDLLPHLGGRDNKTIVADPFLVTAATAHIVFKDLSDWQDLQPNSGQLWALISPRYIKDLPG